MLFSETFPPIQTSLSNGIKRSSSAAVYNFDIQGGFSWWFSPTFKLGLSYRLDAFSARCGLPRTTAAFPATIMGPSSHCPAGSDAIRGNWEITHGAPSPLAARRRAVAGSSRCTCLSTKGWGCRLAPGPFEGN